MRCVSACAVLLMGALHSSWAVPQPRSLQLGMMCKDELPKSRCVSLVASVGCDGYLPSHPNSQVSEACHRSCWSSDFCHGARPADKPVFTPIRLPSQSVTHAPTHRPTLDQPPSNPADAGESVPLALLHTRAHDFELTFRIISPLCACPPALGRHCPTLSLNLCPRSQHAYPRRA